MTLTGGRLRGYEVPFRRPYVTASVRHETRRGFLVELAGEDGTRGLGEAAPLGSRIEDHPTCRKALAETLSGWKDQAPTAEDALAHLGEEAGSLADAPAARFALSEALQDLLARQAGVPLARWLADRHDGCEHLPRTVPVNATVPVMDLEDTLRAARQAVEAGFETLKLKVGTHWQADRRRVEAVREAVGPDVALRLDVNQAWTPMQAIERLGELEQVGLAYVEQPTPEGDLKGLALVRECTSTKIAADEPVRSPQAAQEILDLDAADVLILKPMVLGGIDRTLEVARLAREAGLDVVVTSTIDGAVARAGALHAAASLPEPALACGLATADLLDGDVVEHEERIERGRMHVPTVAGHGLTWQQGGPR